jgi:hypothetical protein
VKAARNVAIVAILALAVTVLPGGGTAAGTFGAALFVVLTVGLGVFAARLYMEHRIGLYGLGDNYRALLYGAIALAVLTVAAGPRLFGSGPGTIAWIVLIAVACYALYLVVRHAREY